MNRKLLAKAVLGGALLIVIDIIFVYLDIYWILPWSDLIMHFLGGAVALILAYSFSRQIFWLVFFVIAASLFWEWSERFIGLAKPLEQSLYDTILDLAMGLIGAVFTYYLISRKK